MRIGMEKTYLKIYFFFYLQMNYNLMVWDLIFWAWDLFSWEVLLLEAMDLLVMQPPLPDVKLLTVFAFLYTWSRGIVLLATAGSKDIIIYF